MKKLLICLSFICVQLLNSQSKETKEFSILFVGNSLTYYNDLPGLVKEYAKTNKEININTQMIAFPNYAIEDHWNEGKIQKLLSSKSFDFIVIQQGPSSQEEGRKMLIDYGEKIKKIAESSNSKLCYFMVWPALNYYNTFNKVIQNHKEAANHNEAVLIPVGEYWKNYIEENNDYSFYGTDRFHPSQKGSKIAAKIIVDTLFNKQN
ncbi:SGNH/GDSL hydrolase family protein [Tenacibaculum sp. MEBiC06402]|uniref:SGNH/GDSL hydrolase family protein n=1 Tax=unclassified Tenacibaculum TaxID=2635139 RepID=UPI003B9B8364